MITPMKKVSVMCLAEDRDKVLSDLQNLGLLHVTPCSAPSGETIEDARKSVEEAHTALSTLDCEIQHHHKFHGLSQTDVDSAISDICRRYQQYLHKDEHLTNLRHLRHTLRPYGNFNPATVRELARKGITVKLYHTRDIEALDLPEETQIHILSQDKTGTYFAAIAQNEFSLNATELQLPEKSLEEVRQEISDIKEELAGIREGVCQFMGLKNKISETLKRREEELDFSKVHDTLGRHGKLVYLKGFCPADAVEKLTAEAKQHGWGLLIEAPGADDNVPTLIRFPRWVKPIKAVIDMLSILPGYHEADISSVFLVFFSIFFAILIGDAGYGMLFLGVTIYARKKLKDAPAYPFILFGILSICTIIWGALTGNYFGIKPDILPPVLQGLQLDALSGDKGQNNIMRICFLIGAVHLTIAHIWNIMVLAPDKKAIAQLGWIGLVWSMYFTALNMVLQAPMPSFFKPLIIISTVLILLFMTSPKDMKSEWIHHAMFPLSMVNCFVDIVSYIRLFAVGLASLSVAMSFNDMATQFEWSQIWTIPIIAAILLLGHTLNIILCALGILVHGVRLNTLEFSMHKGLEWKGLPYRPFARKTETPET